MLRLNLMRLSGETSHQASEAVLEVAVLGGVDQRIDAAVGDHQHHGEVVEPAATNVRGQYKDNEVIHLMRVL